MTQQPYELWARVDLYARADANALAVLAALDAEPWPAVTRWSTPHGANPEPRAGSLRDALTADPALAREKELAWWHGDDVAVTFGPVNQPGAGARVYLSIPDVKPEHSARWLVAIQEWLTRLLEARQAFYALVTRRGPGGTCVPHLDYLGGTSHIVAISDPTLAELLEAPDDAIAAGRWKAQRFFDVQLLLRAFHARTPGEMLGATEAGQWAMARMARPGVTRYNRAEPTEDELPIFKKGAPLVLSLGYQADDQIAVYSCAPSDDEHIRPWEIFALRDLLAAGKQPTGEPVKAVEVIFPLESDAEREARPLQDIGVHVRYYDDEGELATLGEAPAPR
jgi:hypothetical protein